jgi:hypothetical protein
MPLGLVRVTRQIRNLFGILLGAVLLASSLGAVPIAASPRYPSVRFVQLAKLDGYRLTTYHGGWSPRRPLLLLTGRGGEYVWDARKPGAPPVHLPFQAWVRLSAWSPAGDRILFVVGDANPKNLRALLVAKSDGSSVDTLLDQVDCWPVMWAPDASIYYRSGDRLGKIEPPKSWSIPADVVGHKGPFLEGGGHEQIRRISRDGSEVLLGNARLEGEIVSLRDEILETDRHLLMVSGLHGGDYVIDAHGTILHTVRWTMSPNSISRDGELVAGGAGVVADDNRETVDTLRIAYPRGGWCVPVLGAEAGADPQLARTDSLIAFNAPHGGVVVGRYEIRSR